MTNNNQPPTKEKEKTMNTQNENQENAQNSAYNPFPQPQTIPHGWDTSVFASAQQDDVDESSDESVNE